MLKIRKLALMVNLAIFLALLSYNPIESANNLEPDCRTDEIDIDIPDISGPVDNLPWANDEDFLKAKEDNNTPILMGAFCSVMIDPLPGEEHNVNLAAKSVKNIVLQPGEIFSQNESIGPYTEERGYKTGSSFAGNNIVQTEGGGVCKIATTLYNVATLCNMEIVERHYHSMPVNYVPYGQDATVAYGYKDFRFKNNKDFPMLIWSEKIGPRLYIGFYGQEKTPEVEWEHNITNKVEYPTYYRENTQLKEGEQSLLLKGIDGATVESKVNVKYKDGSIEVKDMGISIYMPLPNIIERGKAED